MPLPPKLKGRYEIREVLGQGGMGLVYKAFDAVVKREVALKTLRDAPTRAALQLFYKECEVLATLSHPNIIEIFDVGEYEENGAALPYFVMPLLPGATLDRLIRDSSHRLTVERSVDIMLQTCRGLHAAHERGLVHRDLKPSNIFVMQDDSVKIIDFGVAHMVNTHSSMRPKGTLLYMAPEQLQMKPPSSLSDLFSLGVMCYETITRRRPFERGTETDIVEAILHYVPPPASELNPSANQSVSRVIHKAMAKQPWHRFSSVKEFAETLQKAMRNEPIECFDASRIQPRIQRAAKAFESGDHQFAAEILSELEAEGHVDPSITMLRRQIDQTLRQQTIRQLLDHARTRFDHEEYPLSLQKVHEVLELDSGNSAALGLKTSIENKMTSMKIEEWFRLARRHIDNHGYSHARQAVQNVLQLKPKESRALEMLAEVDRLEKEYLRIRSEKEALYRSALDAWQNGEVSSAMTKLDRVLELDRRAPDASAPERTASYQNLYNQVRSEHESIKNSYAEARKHLADRNFLQALAICDSILAKRPGDALFQALKVDIEEQQRQEVSAQIAEIDKQAEAEPDLDRRVGMLEEAVKTYPGEPHFEKALRLARDKRDLVNSIVGKARMLEERGQYTEALGQWEILTTIYQPYPGLSFEIDRVTARREQQARAEAKGRWIEQIERQMQSGNYTKALETLPGALAEFPGDAELTQLQHLVRDRQERRAEAQQLLARGLEACSQEHFEEGIAVLRQAHEFDPDNGEVRAALVDTLVEQARPMLEKDWRAAESLVEQALVLDPGHLLAKSVRTLILDRKKEDEVVRCFTQVRQLRASGDLRAALAEAETCLATYPLEPRLVQLRDVLIKEMREADHKAGQAAGAAASAASAGPAGPPFTAPVPRSSVAAPLEPADRAAELPATVLAGSTQAESKPATPAPAPPAPPVRPPKPPKAPKAKAAKPAPGAAKAPPAGQPASRKNLVWAVAAGAGVLLLLLGGAFVAMRLAKKPAAVSIAVEVRTSPPGATLRINNEPRGTSNTKVQLAPGRYTVEAVLPGYQPASRAIEVTPQGLAPVELTLQPLAQTVRLVSNLESAQASLDEQTGQPLQDGQLTFDNLPPGKHSLKISDKNSEAAFSFEITPGAAPSVTGPVTAKEVVALVLTTAEGRARVYSNLAAGKVAVDGQPAGELSGGTLELNLPAGNREIALGEGKDARKFVVEVTATPTLTAQLQSDRNVGTILILTNQDGATVFVNGQKYSRPTRRGQLRITREPKEYRVHVAKEGYEDTPEQVVQVHKGEETKLQFELRELPTIATLAVRGAAPGAQVFIDQNPAGTVDADGNFSTSNVKPGDHSIEFRKDPFKPKTVRRSFTAGQTVQLGPAEVAMEAAQGSLRLTISPANARVTLQSASGGPARNVTETTLSLPPGKYTLTARAPGYTDRTENVEVIAGQPRPVDLTLSPMRAAAPAPIPADPMQGWDQPGEWKAQDRWHVRRGGEFVLYRPTPNGAKFAFTLLTPAGSLLHRGRLQWVANYRNEKNYLLFQFDKDTFRRIQCVNGKKTEVIKKPHGVPPQDNFIVATLQVEIAPAAIVLRVRKPNNLWVVLDSLPGENLSQGRFGLYIPGNDEVSIADFSMSLQ